MKFTVEMILDWETHVVDWAPRLSTAQVTRDPLPPPRLCQEDDNGDTQWTYTGEVPIPRYYVSDGAEVTRWVRHWLSEITANRNSKQLPQKLLWQTVLAALDAGAAYYPGKPDDSNDWAYPRVQKLLRRLLAT